ncbi:MAG: RNA polymerase sigma factor [Actinobacteria bacterium]|nr:RNA polymerase sigma factor [Actinomycetota bacterium]
MDGVSDDALLAGFASGDGAAATAFVRRFQARVYGVALAVVGDRARADDVAQEAFVRAWRAAATFDARRGSVPTWLLAITRNAAIDAVRAERVRPTTHLDELVLRVATSVPGPPTAAEADDERTVVVAALRQLPPEQRRAVVLAALGGRTAQEVSRIDGIPLGTAKTRIRTGLRKLRTALAVRDEVEP